MASIYKDPDVTNAVQTVLTNAWNKMDTHEKALVVAKMKVPNNPPTIEEILKWGPFTDYSEDTVMKKALQSKVKSWFTREAKRLNKLTEQSDFDFQVDEKVKLSKPRLHKIRVPFSGDAIYTNDTWDNGITKAALLMVRFGLGSFSTFASCFIYFKSENGTETNHVAKLVNGPNGTKVVKYVTI